MPRLTPASYLRIGSLAVAVVIFSLLLLFLTSTPLDPLIQSVTLAFYLAAIAAMAGMLRSHFKTVRSHDTPSQIPLSGQRSGEKEIENPPLSEPTAHRASSATTQPMEQRTETCIILLTRHDHVAKDIAGKLLGWNYELDIVSSCAEASQLLLNRVPTDADTSEMIAFHRSRPRYPNPGDSTEVQRHILDDFIY